ncbi:NADH-quinone oxidoreductase subunit L [Tepidiforma sp.]|jgi:NADH-quinone oxidoreductase subunit L|uniref:NADH-quinone oxidoreductase subunit L n=1 Tax=Tepidiforma sp. TaxID=2682230 RepID=UPI0026297121|nr:NADH-quinone oxidoreductase subunit L [Tepidiforma sp.]MCX7617460.1 NADH-quinone oxidoreductase subunit L [Tepidiforma sp.]
MPFLAAEPSAASTPTIDQAVLWAIMACPLVAWALIALYLRKLPAIAGYAAILGIGAAMVLSYVTLFNVIDASGGVAQYTHEWFTAGDLTVPIGVRVDGLTAVMLVVVTTVAFLVQVYSTGYMQGDHGYGRYFAHMCLFTTSMLGLVLADNLFQMFVFWELVGLCSYLLIGFWFHKPSAAAAAKKAFIVTRIGDLGLLAALLLIWTRAGTFDVTAIQEWAASGEVKSTIVTLFALGLFAGAAGKSAQFPLHVWLPDAMEGPTPVSALIHAATMVAAGVYLVARFFPVFEASTDAADVVAWIGAITAILAATIALVQTDLKRVLAYSTVSQLGYMMLSLGALGYVAAIFHLFTHAFFKALLFLGSGSVNHATNTFDMRKMGGLRKHMPVTYWTFVIGSLSLAGIFPLAGFWSKDEILLDAWRHDRALWAIGAVVAFMTAFYMFRAIFLTFHGTYKGGEPVDHHDPDNHFHGDPAHPHESPWSMKGPLIVLAIPSIAAGWFAYDHMFKDFIEAALPHGGHHGSTFEIGIAVSSTIIALAGIGTAYAIYIRRWVDSASIRATFAPFALVFERKYFLDDLYEGLFVRTIFYRGWCRLLETIDRRIVDGIVNGTGQLGRAASSRLRAVQVGEVQSYGLGVAAGVIVIFIAVIVANPL